MEIDHTVVSDFLYKVGMFGVTDFERNFDPTAWIKWTESHYEIPIIAIVVYLVFCFGVQRILEGKEKYDLKMPLAYWNMALSVFSFTGMFRTMPILIARVLSMNYEDTVCEPPIESWGAGPTGLWVMLFIYSKLPELVDTVFIVLRKRPLIFLHWYHHISVLFFCWNAYATLSAAGLYFVAMNYSVHAFMYGYFCLVALNMCPKSFPTILITLSQIMQMFVGTGVCMSAWYFWYQGRTCSNDITNLICGGFMYGSYLYLFTAFAFKRYTKKPKTASGEDTTPASKDPKKNQ